MTRFIFLISAFICTSLTLAEDQGPPRVLFDLHGPDASKQWQTVNDGVMGGRSEGRFRINEKNHLEFFGNLSLQNNGGFASVRSIGQSIKLQDGDTIMMTVRGDGREYTLNLYTPSRRMAFSYRTTFKTKNGEWIQIRAPLESFAATSFGRVVRNAPLQPEQISELGVLLGDKKAGPFKLEIKTIVVASTTAP